MKGAERSVLAIVDGQGRNCKASPVQFGFAGASARCAKGEAACAAIERPCLQRCPNCNAKKIKPAAKKNTIKMMQWHKLSAARGIQITRRTIKKENTDDIRLCNRGVDLTAGRRARAQVQAQVKPVLRRGTCPYWKHQPGLSLRGNTAVTTKTACSGLYISNSLA